MGHLGAQDREMRENLPPDRALRIGDLIISVSHVYVVVDDGVREHYFPVCHGFVYGTSVGFPVWWIAHWVSGTESVAVIR